MDTIKQKLDEKILIRKSLEDRIINEIRNGKDLPTKDLNDIFALSVTIKTLEELIF